MQIFSLTVVATSTWRGAIRLIFLTPAFPKLSLLNLPATSALQFVRILQQPMGKSLTERLESTSRKDRCSGIIKQGGTKVSCPAKLARKFPKLCGTFCHKDCTGDNIGIAFASDPTSKQSATCQRSCLTRWAGLPHSCLGFCWPNGSMIQSACSLFLFLLCWGIRSLSRKTSLPCSRLTKMHAAPRPEFHHLWAIQPAAQALTLASRASAWLLDDFSIVKLL